MSPPPLEKQTSTASTNSKKSSKSGAISTPKEKNNNNENTQTDTANNENADNESPEDKFKRFEGEGVVFKAKLVGTELVMEPRGDKMCQNSIQRLKAIIKGQKAHKRRIVMKISYLGVKIYDEKTNEILHHHEVPQISFIASDDSDTRTFGYVCDVPSKAHQFICFKTAGPAIQVMSVISSLFEAVLEKKNKAASSGDKDLKEPTRKGSQATSEGQDSSSVDANNDGKNANKLTKVDSLTGDLDGLEFVSRPAPVHFGAFDLANSIAGNPNMASPFGAPPANTQQLKSSQSGLDLVSDQLGYLVLGGSTSVAPNAPNNNNNNTGSNSNIYSPPARAPLAASASVDSTYGSSNNTTTNSSSLSHNDSTDKYAVFNDIENLPSIFESTSSLNSLGGGMGGPARHHQQQQQPFQQQAAAASYGSGKPPGGLFHLNRSNNNISSGPTAATSPFGDHQLAFPGGQQFGNFNSMAGFEPHQQQQAQSAAAAPTSATNAFFPPGGYSSTAPTVGPHTNHAGQQNPTMLTSSASASAFAFGQANQFQAPVEPGRQPAPTPSMMVPTSVSQAAFRPLNHSSSSGLIVGSAPMSGHQLSQHARFSSSMVGALHQRLGSSAASVQSVGSAGGLSRQTNPFDDDFFA